MQCLQEGGCGEGKALPRVRGGERGRWESRSEDFLLLGVSLSLSCRHWGRESCQVHVLMKLFGSESKVQNVGNKIFTIIGLYLVLEIACYVSQFQIMPYLFEIAFRR